MNKHDVIKKLGFPHSMNGQRMTSKVWLCASCNTKHVADTPIPNPAPCRQCNGLSFRKIKEA